LRLRTGPNQDAELVVCGPSRLTPPAFGSSPPASPFALTLLPGARCSLARSPPFLHLRLVSQPPGVPPWGWAQRPCAPGHDAIPTGPSFP
jgi:hypothetical protein